jgi:hypothetical protein
MLSQSQLDYPERGWDENLTCESATWLVHHPKTIKSLIVNKAEQIPQEFAPEEPTAWPVLCFLEY